METALSSNVSVNVYQIARRHIPVDSNLMMIELWDMRHQKKTRGRRIVCASDKRLKHETRRRWHYGAAQIRRPPMDLYVHAGGGSYAAEGSRVPKLTVENFVKILLSSNRKRNKAYTSSFHPYSRKLLRFYCNCTHYTSQHRALRPSVRCDLPPCFSAVTEYRGHHVAQGRKLTPFELLCFRFFTWRRLWWIVFHVLFLVLWYCGAGITQSA
jgi:hypothetical protein